MQPPPPVYCLPAGCTASHRSDAEQSRTGHWSHLLQHRPAATCSITAAPSLLPGGAASVPARSKEEAALGATAAGRKVARAAGAAGVAGAAAVGRGMAGAAGVAGARAGAAVTAGTGAVGTGAAEAAGATGVAGATGAGAKGGAQRRACRGSSEAETKSRAPLPNTGAKRGWIVAT